MANDAELLSRYAATHDEAAFGEIVQRHLNLVYAVALRQVGGDAHLAQDVAQRVFTDLARKAPALAVRATLGGWLFRATQFTASDIVRAERARRVREQEAQLMQERCTDPNAATDWEKLRPMLDAAVGELGERERDAVVLRFFDSRPFAEIGATLRVSEDAARMRVERALEKLRTALARRGVTSTGAALAAALANQIGVAAPAGLAASVTGAAVAGSAAVGTSAVIVFMGMTKLQIVVAAAIAIAATASYVLQGETNTTLRQEIAAARAQQQAAVALRVENRQLTATAAEVDALRRDDIALKQLEQHVAEIKQANAERARVAQVRPAQNRRQEFEARIRADDERAQQQIERMTREVQVLIDDYRTLSAQAKDSSLTPQIQAQAAADVQAKLETIKSKQEEIRAFIANTSRARSQREEALRSLPLDGSTPTPPPPKFRPGGGRIEANRVPVTSDGTEANPPSAGSLSDPKP